MAVKFIVGWQRVAKQAVLIRTATRGGLQSGLWRLRHRGGAGAHPETPDCQNPDRTPGAPPTHTDLDGPLTYTHIW